MHGKLQYEQHDLKRVSNLMTVMSENSRKAMMKLTDEASHAAYKQLKALEDDNDVFDEDSE
eukprot:633139-Ditylum_brightwellii.AAC.1